MIRVLVRLIKSLISYLICFNGFCACKLKNLTNKFILIQYEIIEFL